MSSRPKGHGRIAGRLNDRRPAKLIAVAYVDRRERDRTGGRVRNVADDVSYVLAVIPPSYTGSLGLDVDATTPKLPPSIVRLTC